MTKPSARAAARLALILCSLTCPASVLWAQNENETVGFQSNHAFESGHFGENIDVLNGGLHLTVPIGAKYQVNDRLGFQLTLSYNSKIWDYSDYHSDITTTVRPYNESPTGIGFTLNLGRLLQDTHERVCTDNVECKMRTWKWIGADGNQHDVWFVEDFTTTTAPTEYPVVTSDTTYVRVYTPGSNCRTTNLQTGETAEDLGCFTVKTPDGLTYTLGHHVNYPEDDSACTPSKCRGDNLSFGGWYVTRIEDRSVGMPDASGLYPMNVRIEYDKRPGFEHVMKTITDGYNRQIQFTNCKCDATGTCDRLATAADKYIDPATGHPTTIDNRHPIATCQIDVPAFSGTGGASPVESVAQPVHASYQFTYAYTPIRHTNVSFQGSTDNDGPVLELTRIDYPPYTHRNGSPETDSQYFGYTGQEGIYPNRGELSCRTLLVPRDSTKTCYTYGGVPSFRYAYDYYAYSGLFLTAGKGAGITKSNTGFVSGPSITSATREVTSKQIIGLDSNTYEWKYVRLSDAGATNPRSVTVTDQGSTRDCTQSTPAPRCNDTVYYYHFTQPANASADVAHNGSQPDDGLAPDWDDGLLYRVEYYRGSGSTRQLVRSETSDYEADPSALVFQGSTEFQKANTRETRKVTIYNDDSGTETAVSRTNWDGYGNWGTVSETGFDVAGTRNKSTAYFSWVPLGVSGNYLTGLAAYEEVHDGQRVLGRTDNDFDSTGRPTVRIERKILPPTIGTPQNTTSFGDGDVKTTLSHDTSTGSITSKTLGRWRDSSGGLVDEYCIDYSWNLGAYLETKTFRNRGTDGKCSSGTQLQWKAIERKRDGNTGAIFSTKDTAGVETTYNYDVLGRLTDITPLPSEFASAIDYVSLLETTVTRGDSTNYQFSRYQYDSLGRLIREERRPADPTGGNPYRTTCYDIENRPTFKSEWMKPGTYSGPDPCDRGVFPGTTFDYGTPPDPFGRVLQVTTADNQTTTTTYQGLDSTVTVNNVMGVSATGGSGSVSTTYHRDGRGLLLMVDAPSEKRCDTWGATCTKDADCNLSGQTNHLCKATDGADAFYYYDQLDNLVQADLIDQSTGNRQSRFFQYDALNHLYASFNPESGNAEFTDYDSLGNLRTAIDASGTTLQDTYDPAGRQTRSERVANPSVVLAENDYDFGSNAGGKLTASTVHRDDGSLFLQKFYTYSGLNGRLSALTYRFLDWPFGSTDQNTTFTYDAFGNLNGISYPAGAGGNGGALPVSYDFANGIPTAVRDMTGNVLASVTYNPAGGVDSVTTLGGARTQIQYDKRNRPLDITIGRWSAGAFQGTPYYETNQYSYDGAGNIYRMGAPNSSPKNHYYYDSANRLKEVYETEDGVNYMQCFAYDAFGNMIGKVDKTGVASTDTCQGPFNLPWDDTFYVTAPNGSNTNRILNEQLPGTSVAVNFLYDAKGNVTKDWERRFLYDSRNRMTSIFRVSNSQDPTSPAAALSEYDYDNDGNRIIKRDRVRDLTTYYFRGPDGNLLTEFRRTALGNYLPEWTKEHVYLAGREVGFRDNRVPSPPGRLTATTTQSYIKLQWKKNPSEENVASYTVYRGIWGGTPVYLTSTTGNCTPDDPSMVCFSDSSVGSATYYSYQVVAVAGTYSSYGSDIVGLTAGDTTPPSPPTCLRLKAGDQSVTASWTAPGGEIPQGYNVYRSTSSGGQKTRVTQSLVPGTTYVDAGLQNGTTYYYSVKSVDMVGNASADIVNTGCSPAADTSAQPKDYAPPGPPRNLVVTGDCSAAGTASLTWDPNPDTDQVRSYQVYRKSATGVVEGPWSSPLDNSTNPPTPLPYYNDSGLTRGAIYYYWVVARDATPNDSVPSQKVGVAQRSNSLPVPSEKLIVMAGDGVVKVRFTRPTDSTRVSSFVIYRKPNAQLSCGTFQLVTQIFSPGLLCSGGTCTEDWGATTTFDVTDGSVTNNMAWDYAVASRDRNLNESAMSEAALAIPVAAPKDFRQCVEAIPAGSATEWTTCTCTGFSGICRNHVVRWDPPPTKPYHPISASNADGTLGYLLGYHEKYYTYATAGALPVQDSVQDKSAFNEENLSYLDTTYKMRCAQTGVVGDCGANPWAANVCGNSDACVPVGLCRMDGVVLCPPNQCVTGTSCVQGCSTDGHACTHNQDCPGGTCTNVCDVGFTTYCIQKTDCPATAYCRRDLVTPVDPYLLQVPGPRLVYPIEIGARGNCVTIESVYKVYANGDWITSTSQPSSNFDLTKTSADTTSIGGRCLQKAFDVCDPTAPLCDPATEPPEITTAPQATIPVDGSGKQIPGKLTVTWSGPTIPADQARVAGYYLYVKELGPTLPEMPYGFERPQPFIQVGSGETCADGRPCYEFTTLPRDRRAHEGGASATYQFQVATFDTQGRIGKASPLSTPASTFSSVPAGSQKPLGLKTVIWTVNDASGDAASSLDPFFPPDPRSYDGIKLQWKSGAWLGLAGFRVYRSETRDGGYCALVQAGGALLDAPVCPDPAGKNTLFTTSLTRGVNETSNSRFFLDKNITPGTIYYYKVKSVGDATSSASETGFSDVVAGMALEHPALPLSPPRHLQAWAPRTPAPGPGVNLRWCPNRPDEQVTGYNVYRSDTSGGPYKRIAYLTVPTYKGDDCLLGSKKCTINCATLPCDCTPAPCGSANSSSVSMDPTVCTVGLGGTCKLMDMGVLYPHETDTPSAQAPRVYYYVVTAVRGTEESAYSQENGAWPNYLCTQMSCPPNGYIERYDQDNSGAIACDDETSSIESLERDFSGFAPAATRDGAHSDNDDLQVEGGEGTGGESAPYRVIGERRPGGGGGGGNPPPQAIGRWLFLHGDHLGSARVVVDDLGNKISSHHYMPFGDEKPLAGRVTSNNIKFTGHERDVESAASDNPDGLDYMLARYYSSSLGRFLAVDPRDDTDPESPQSWNRYAYVRNNPIKSTDPTGTRENIGPLHPERVTAAQVEASTKEVGKIATNIAKGAAIVKVGALAAAPILAVTGVGAAGALAVAATAGGVEAGADLVALNMNPTSTENLTAVATDAAGAGVSAVAGACFTAANAGTQEVGEAVGEAITTTAAAVAPGMAEVVQPSPPPATRPTIITTPEEK